MGGSSNSKRLAQWSATLLLALVAVAWAKGKNKSYTDDGGSEPSGSVSSGGGGQAGQQMVTIPIELNYRTARADAAAANQRSGSRRRGFFKTPPPVAELGDGLDGNGGCRRRV